MNAHSDMPQDSFTEWSEKNQAALVAEFALLRQRLKIDDEIDTPSDSEANNRKDSDADFANTSINYIHTNFNLSQFERDLLLLCAAIEMDQGVASACAKLQETQRSQHHFVSFGLALQQLDDAHWSAITPQSALRYYQFTHLDETDNLLQAKLRIDERMLHYLAGINYLEPRLQALLTPGRQVKILSPSQLGCANSIHHFLQQQSHATQTIALHGNDTSGQEDIATHVANELGLQLFIIEQQHLPTSAQDIELFTRLWERELILLKAALLIKASEETTEQLSAITQKIKGLVFVSHDKPINIGQQTSFTVDYPNSKEQRLLWETLTESISEKLNGSLDSVSAQFRFNTQQIDTIAKQLTTLTEEENHDEALLSICRNEKKAGLNKLGEFINANVYWDDLVLAEQEKQTLRHIASHVKQRLKVYNDWGFANKGPRGLGISALFSGESGTGKTLAAEVLANELQLDLYRIDLSSIVSKYIGETEKNLNRIFTAAENSGAILLFDEADALFGKRSEVKDSHDRYANLEVSYLLQRMEAYSGLAILTTNLRKALDTAFLRRIRFIVNFPFPDIAQREQIWRNVFPAQSPIDALDYKKLSKLNMAGGNIRNIALNAAFIAAETGGSISMKELAQAAHSEAAKKEQALCNIETRGWN